jgi:hypothetical protein
MNDVEAKLYTETRTTQIIIQYVRLRTESTSVIVRVCVRKTRADPPAENSFEFGRPS